MRCGIYPLARQEERQCISCVFRAGEYYLPHATTCLEFLGKVVPPLGFTRWQLCSSRNHVARSLGNTDGVVNRCYSSPSPACHWRWLSFGDGSSDLTKMVQG